MESDYRVEIGGLIVDERWRRTGLGRRLVQAIENWAVESGAAELSVRCREERAESHKFYECLSFRHTKTQRVFRKRIGNAAYSEPGHGASVASAPLRGPGAEDVERPET